MENHNLLVFWRLLVTCCIFWKKTTTKFSKTYIPPSGSQTTNDFWRLILNCCVAIASSLAKPCVCEFLKKWYFWTQFIDFWLTICLWSFYYVYLRNFNVPFLCTSEYKKCSLKIPCTIGFVKTNFCSEYGMSLLCFIWDVVYDMSNCVMWYGSSSWLNFRMI